MDYGNTASASPSNLESTNIRWHYPYFTLDQVRELSERQRGKMSITQEDKARQQASAFIEAVGLKMGFPRKTIASGQNLYHRFHLFFPRKDFNYYDVTLAALYVSTKMHDTLKKPREILMVAYAVRNPELAAKSKVAGELDIDPQKLEHDRQRLLAVERLILETICFNFKSRMPFPYVIKLGRALGANKRLAKLAWRLASDSFWTLVNLEYPPHVVAMACIYLSSLLSSFEQEGSPDYPACHQLASSLSQHGEWERRYKVRIEDLEEISHSIIDLLIQAVQNPILNTSPSTPASPHPTRSQRLGIPDIQTPQPPYNFDQLMRLKIAMRETEHPPRERYVPQSPSIFQEETDPKMLGRNEGTVRFTFEPSWYSAVAASPWAPS